MVAPASAVRCEGHTQDGHQCRREAILGSTVCWQHGGAAPQVRAKAAARIGNLADEMVKRLITMLDDPNVDARDKVKIAQDMLDRAGLNATEKHIVEIDPVEALFKTILGDPNGLAAATPEQHIPSPEIAALNRAAMEYDDPEPVPADIVDAEVVEDDDPHTIHTAGSITPKPPVHIQRDLKRLGLL